MAKVQGTPKPQPKPPRSTQVDADDSYDSNPPDDGHGRFRSGPDQDFNQRLSSPERRVRFTPKLEQGPTVSDPSNRTTSPSRSAMRDLASEQLLREEADAQQNPSSAEQKGVQRCRRPSPGSVRKQLVTQSTGDDHRTHVAPGAEPYQSGSKFSDWPKYSADADEKDRYVCSQLNELRKTIAMLARALPDIPQDRHDLLEKLGVTNEHTIRYMGNLAMAGNEGVQSWVNLFQDYKCRQALVFGVVGRALKEWVFSDLWFGGSEPEIDALVTLEQRCKEQDGFHRTKQRAAKCCQFQKQWVPKPAVDTNYLKAKTKISLQLMQLLMPLWYISDNSSPKALPRYLPFEARRLTAQVVHQAAGLSRFMRLQVDVVYYWPPTFKDEEFERARMECLDLFPMLRDSPYQRQLVNGSEHTVLLPDKEEQKEAIVRVVSFPGLVAYRQGGGDLAARLLKAEERRLSRAPPDVRASAQHGKDPDVPEGDQGYRTRILCKSVVHLQWGRQRLLTKEAGTSAHLEAQRKKDLAKYSKDSNGSIELHQLWKDLNKKAQARRW